MIHCKQMIQMRYSTYKNGWYMTRCIHSPSLKASLKACMLECITAAVTRHDLKHAIKCTNKTGLLLWCTTVWVLLKQWIFSEIRQKKIEYFHIQVPDKVQKPYFYVTEGSMLYSYNACNTSLLPPLKKNLVTVINTVIHIYNSVDLGTAIHTQNGNCGFSAWY